MRIGLIVRFDLMILGALMLLSLSVYGQDNTLNIQLEPIGANKERIIGSDSDSGKYLVAVVGEGYSASLQDQEAFKQHVDRLVVNGLFQTDVFFVENKEAFSVYRVNLISEESGVSRPNGHKETALGVTFTGNWETRWFQEAEKTTVRLKQALNNGPAFDYVLIIVNVANHEAGVAFGNSRLYVAKDVDPGVVAHELGHVIAGLNDEYVPRGYESHEHPSDQPYNNLNCSTETDRGKLIWRNLLTNEILLPTNPQSIIDLADTVGMFEGCMYRGKKIYRPMYECRMNDPRAHHSFCEVCKTLLTAKINERRFPSFILQPFLNIEILLKEGGDSEVISIKEVQEHNEQNTNNQVVSNYFFEIRRDGQTYAFQFLPRDPFEVRILPDDEKQRPEVIKREKMVPIIIKIPKTDSEDITKENLTLRFFRLRAEKIPSLDSLEKIDLMIFNQLKKRGYLDKFTDISTQELNNENIIQIKNF